MLSDDLRGVETSPAAPRLARLESDPDFALIAERWADLPEAIKAGILAMVRASGHRK